MNRQASRRLTALVVAVLGMVAFASPAWAETFTVTNTDDFGDGSLRAAVGAANGNGAGADTITFSPALTENGDARIELSEAAELSNTWGNSALLARSEIRIEGPAGENGITIARNASAPDEMRLFRVRDIKNDPNDDGKLTLSNLALEDGTTLPEFAGSSVSDLEDRGGGILNEGTLTLTNSTVSNSSATNRGGGIHNVFGGTVTITNSTISGNSASAGGGGVRNDGGTVTITNSTISGNSARGGGGAMNVGTMTMANSTLSGNSATNAGGGVLGVAGTTTIRNSTITANSAPAGEGAGVVSGLPDSDDATTVVRSSIISGNTGTDVDSTTPFSSEGYNVVGDGGGTTGFDAPGDQKGVSDPRLLPLAANGGPTRTHLPLEDSPVLDAGDDGSTDPTTDQRGEGRPQDFTAVPDASDGSDVGAVEAEPAAVSVSGATVTEGGPGATTTASFAVRLSRPASVPVTVDYATEDDTASSPGDYAAASGTLTFDPGQTGKTIPVEVAGDDTDEPTEGFFVNLSGASPAAIALDAGATGTIRDDDEAPTLSISDTTATEGDSGTGDAAFTATLSAPSGKTVGVEYTTRDGSALAGSDYAAASGTLAFSPGQTSRTINVPVVGDTEDEADETFEVAPGSPQNATVLDGAATGTITDDDEPNGVPVASDDSYATAEDTPLVVEAPGILQNDSDADGGTLTAAKVSDPLHGTLSLQPNGFFLYTPDENFNGQDSFTYKASDGTDESNVAAVTIAVSPTAEPPAPNAAPTVTALTPKPGARLRDRTPTIRATVADGETDLARGDIRLWVDGKSVGRFSYDPATDRLSYASRKLDHGRHTVLIVARDGAGLSESKFWTFRVGR